MVTVDEIQNGIFVGSLAIGGGGSARIGTHPPPSRLQPGHGGKHRHLATKDLQAAMSAFTPISSALPPEADILRLTLDFRF